MLFGEFVEGTGCRETDKNYQIYKDLEVIYMNTGCSKEHIYEMGKKLVDNSKTEAELKLEKQINEEIAELKEGIAANKTEIEYRKAMIELWKQDGDKEMEKSDRRYVKYLNEEIKRYRNRIAALKWVLA